MTDAGSHWSWQAFSVLLGLLAILLWWQPAPRWDWQPGLALSQPWRWFSAAGVHFSAMHLVANLAGLLLLAILGWRSACGLTATTAWALAWPLTHLALALEPALAHYGGLSGVLHAGVAVVGCQLICRGGRSARAGPRRHRVGWLLLTGLSLKIVLEAPWHGPVRQVPGWDIAIAPLAHASGTAAGLLCASLLLRWAATRAGVGRRSPKVPH